MIFQVLVLLLSQALATAEQTPRDFERLDRDHERILQGMAENESARETAVRQVTDRISNAENAIVPEIRSLTEEVAALNVNVDKALKLAERQKEEGRRQMIAGILDMVSDFMMGFVFPLGVTVIAAKYVRDQRRRNG